MAKQKTSAQKQKTRGRWGGLAAAHNKRVAADVAKKIIAEERATNELKGVAETLGLPIRSTSELSIGDRFLIDTEDSIDEVTITDTSPSKAFMRFMSVDQGFYDWMRIEDFLSIILERLPSYEVELQEGEVEQ